MESSKLNGLKLLLILMLFLLSHEVQATQTTAVDKGLLWLYTHQNSDNSWGERGEKSKFRDTCVVAETLLELGVNNDVLKNALDYIEAADVETTDYLARKIIALAKGGRNTATLTTILKSYTNIGFMNGNKYIPGGGHGYKKDWEGTPLDTALAIKAFVAANAIDEDVVCQDVQFLLITSNLTSDHGWDSRYYEETTASIYTTANSLIGLISCDTVNLFAPDWFIQWFHDTIDSNTLWLLNQQNQDGSFGEGTGTTYQTALAALALLETPFKHSDTLSKTVKWLKDQQLPDGSWSQNAYETALAMQVLRQIPEVSLVEPGFGTVGCRIDINGCGYSAGEEIRIDLGTTLSIATTIASAAGTFTAVFRADSQPYGTKTIMANGMGSSRKASSEFFIMPDVQVTPCSGYPGTLVTILGNGYLPSEPIRIDFGVTSTMTIASADTMGRFAVTFTVDSQQIGSLTIKAVGLSSNQTTSCPFRVMSSVIEISGQVLDIDGKPISKARVEVFQLEKYKDKAYTDSDGRYRIGNLPSKGDYSVVTSKITQSRWKGWNIMWNEYIPYIKAQLPSDENVVDLDFMMPRCNQWIQLLKGAHGEAYGWWNSGEGYGYERPNKLQISLNSREWRSKYRFYLSPRDSAKITDYDSYSTGQNGTTYYGWYWCKSCQRWHSYSWQWDFNQKYARIDAAKNRLVIDVTLRGLWWQRAFFNQEYIINTGGKLAPGMVLENATLAESIELPEKRAAKASVSLSFPSSGSDSDSRALAPILGDSRTSIMVRDVEEDLTTAKMTVKFDPGRVQVKDVESPTLPDDGLTVLIDKEIDNETGVVKIIAMVVGKEQLEGSSTAAAQAIPLRAPGFMCAAPAMLLDSPHDKNTTYTPSTYEEIENIAPIAELIIASSNSAQSPPLSTKEMASAICISSIELQDSNGGIIEAEIADNRIVRVESESSLDNACCYPNPTKTGEMVFARLTDQVRVKIYNIAGELIYDRTHTTNGKWTWGCENNDGDKVSSGIYIYLLSDPVTGGTKSGKLGVIR